MPSSSTDVIKRVHEELPEEARGRWTEADVVTMASTVSKGLSANELKMVLSIAAKYDLDPLLREIWGSRAENRDGSPGRLLIMVGRDGLLKNARRSPDYRGFDADVVRKNDHFKVTRRTDGQREIEHSYEGGPDERGEILGAWATVYVAGRGTVYYFAPFQDYVPKTLKDGSSWKNTPSLMIQKCALSLCLRLAFNISGVIGEEEGARALEDAAGPVVDEDAQIADTIVRLPVHLRDRVRLAVDVVREHGGAVSASSIEMRFAGQPPERQAQAADDLESWARRLREAAAARATAEPEEVADAEIVDEPQEGDSDGSPSEIAQAEADSIDAEELRARLGELNARRREIQENPSTEDETSEALEEVGTEIQQVEQALRDLGAEQIPGQESLI